MTNWMVIVDLKDGVQRLSLKLKNMLQPTRDVRNRIENLITNLYCNKNYTLKHALAHITFMDDFAMMEFLRNFSENASEGAWKELQLNKNLILSHREWVDDLPSTVSKLARAHKARSLQNLSSGASSASRTPSSSSTPRTPQGSTTPRTPQGSTALRTQHNVHNLYSNYDFTCVKSLVKFVRNVWVHFKDLNDDAVIRAIGTRPADYVYCSATSFPALYTLTYVTAMKYRVFGVPPIATFNHNRTFSSDSKTFEVTTKTYYTGIEGHNEIITNAKLDESDKIKASPGQSPDYSAHEEVRSVDFDFVTV